MKCSGQKQRSPIIWSDNLADPPYFRNKDYGFFAAVQVNPQQILCNGVETAIAAPQVCRRYNQRDMHVLKMNVHQAALFIFLRMLTTESSGFNARNSKAMPFALMWRVTSWGWSSSIKSMTSTVSASKLSAEDSVLATRRFTSETLTLRFVSFWMSRTTSIPVSSCSFAVLTYRGQSICIFCLLF